MNKLRSKEEWMEHVKRFKESGISINRYCRDNNLKPTSFRHWINKDRKTVFNTRKKENFVKLEVKNTFVREISSHILLKYNSFEITLSADFNKSDLNRLLDVLEERRLCSVI